MDRKCIPNGKYSCRVIMVPIEGIKRVSHYIITWGVWNPTYDNMVPHSVVTDEKGARKFCTKHNMQMPKPFTYHTGANL